VPCDCKICTLCIIVLSFNVARLQGLRCLALIVARFLSIKFFVKGDKVSSFDLAASWRAYQDNFRPSSVRWIPDVSISSAPQTGGEVRSK